ncbi:hypothetical protein PCASD_14356 [Puccinia coronata f. sp. avenae]|uniref:Integrase catalytic domain-containing protein n=1 Tax=Puccinia coronata f. sp. avenae TaxID=200324 RepID=A0A2N5UCV7_9BASI|nr:hypothetical protein PCASD_14356 [Puccinia coronata f. sp. avenae]
MQVSISHPLISFGRLYLKNCALVGLSNNKIAIKDPTSTFTIFDGKVRGKVFTIHSTVLKSHGQSLSSVLFKASQADAAKLHRQAGHPSGEALKLMFGVNYNTMTCESCRLSKSQRLPFSSTLPDAKRVLNFVYMDLSGKITPQSTGGGQYYFKITDAFSSFKHVFILLLKSQALEKFKSYCNEVQNVHSSKIKNVVTEGGGEFCSAEFEKFYAEQGIVHHITAPYTPQKNSIAERGNRTTSEKARSLLKQANLPSSLWGEEVITAVFYENITPMKRLKWRSAYEVWFGKPFGYSRLHSFGCLAYVNIPKEKQKGKFGDTSKKGILMGYRQGIRNWRILTAGNRVKYSHDVIFNDSCFPGISPSSSADTSEFISFNDKDDSVGDPVSSTSSPIDNLRKSLRNASHPVFYSPPSPFLNYPDDMGRPVPPIALDPQRAPIALDPQRAPSPARASQQSHLQGEAAQGSSEAPDAPAVSSDARPKTSWSWVPADQPAQKTNILDSKRRARYANTLLTAQPYFEPLFAMAVTQSKSPSIPKS